MKRFFPKPAQPSNASLPAHLTAYIEIDISYKQLFNNQERFPFKGVVDSQKGVHWTHVTPEQMEAELSSRDDGSEVSWETEIYLERSDGFFPADQVLSRPVAKTHLTLLPREKRFLKLELQQWTEAVHRLPEREREFLQQYLHGSRGSERKLAEANGLSRYAAREQLVRIIGKVIATFGQPGSNEYPDWRVAEAIWLDDRTVDETAALLGLTVEAVKRARARKVGMIVEALRRFESKRGGSVMSNAAGGGKSPIAVETLLYRALTSPGNEALLADLSARSNEIIEYLDSHDFVLPGTAAELLEEVWIAEVYEAIASGSTSAATVQTEQFARELFQASREDLASIGVAFKETLLPDLPTTLV